MARTQFLKPRSVELPAQGDFTFTPVFIFLEDSTMAGLQAQLDTQVGVESLDDTKWVVVEEIEYQVVEDTVNPGKGDWKYSCMIWLTRVDII